MKVVALISGGKDSCYNMMQCVAEGHQLVALANLKPKDCDELDSYMYQTVGHHGIEMYAEAMSLPLYRRTIEGRSKQIDRYYQPTKNDEVEDLYELLKTIKSELHIEGVSCGAILSDYQRVRVENVCERLGLTSLAYLWRRDQEELLQEMINCKVEAIIIKVASLGLDPNKHLGKTLEEIYPHMLKMSDKFGVNICGEGGEFESFTYDCPLFNKKIIIDDVEKVIHSYDPFSPVGYLNVKQIHLQDKNISNIPLHERLKDLPMKRGCDLQKEILSEASSSETVRVADITVEIPPPSNDNVKVLCRKEGNMFYISNIVSYNNSTLSITDQTQLALTRLKDTLSNLKVSTKNMVSVCLYVRNMADFAAVNSVYKTLFDINPPVRGCVEVCLSRNIGLQLDCIGFIKGEDKSTLHVQSISHWASANIGPYSQAVKFDGKIYVAGQIALCPASMTIIEGGIVPQTLLSLRHTDRILHVMAPDCTLNSVLLCICYITKPANIPVVKREWKKEAKTINIKQYGELESSNHTSLIQCIVVPTLPKHGLVEWLVYAAEHTSQLTELNIVENYSNYKVRIDVIHSTDSQNIFTCKASLEVTSSVGIIYKDLIQCLFEEYDKVLIKMKLDWRSVPLLRIFFPTSIFNYDQLFNDVNRSIESLTDISPVFSLIPVIALDTPAQIMSVCH